MIRDRWEAFKNGPAAGRVRLAAMRSARLLVLLAMAVWLAAGAPAIRAQAPPAASGRPTEADLQAITDGGRRIATYHEAITRSRAALAQRQPDQAEARAVAVDRNGVTHVIFLRRDQVGPEARGWVPIADATWQPRAGEVASLVMLDKPKPPAADVTQHLRALEAARGAAAAKSGGPPPPYDEAVFKEPGATAYVVYLQTRPERADAARFGSDARFRISGDGLQVMEMLPLHAETTTVAVPARAGASPTLHSHTQGDLPAETDVAVVLEHPALAPHLVLTPRHMFRIEADGHISWLGPNAVPPASPGGAR